MPDLPDRRLPEQMSFWSVYLWTNQTWTSDSMSCVLRHWPWRWWPPGRLRAVEWSASWPSLLKWWCSTTTEAQSAAAPPSDTVHTSGLEPTLRDCCTSLKCRTWTEHLTQSWTSTLSQDPRVLCFLTKCQDVKMSFLPRGCSHLTKSWHPMLNVQIMWDSRQQGQTGWDKGAVTSPPQNIQLYEVVVVGTSQLTCWPESRRH